MNRQKQASRPTADPTRVRSQALRRTFSAALLLLFLALAGCGTRIPGISAIAPSANPTEEIAALATDLEGARDADLDVLSPTWFETARDAHEQAQRDLASGEPLKQVLQQVAEGRAALAQARTFGAVSQETLGDVITARQDAIEAGGPGLGGDYRRVEERFLALTRGVESDSLSWARRTAPSVEKSFREVELASIKRNSVERIVDLIEKAKKADAERYAPAVLADVQQRYADLDRFISENRYASDVMSSRAAEVLFHANRLVHLTEEARRIEESRPDALALEDESFRATLREKLEMPDLRNLSVPAQRKQLANAIDRLIGQRHDLRTRVEQLSQESESQRGRIVALAGEAEREAERLEVLEAERRFNQLFGEVSALFRPDEAAIYKDGSRLVIRVRSIQFPVGSAVVLPESYPVLAKVQRAIESFPSPNVIVEGHTDSTGSTEVNDRVSQSRADAVLAYMVNNRTIEAGRITAIGKGFSEPLASDRTAEGRAQNRRIDVVIEASGPSLVQTGSPPAVSAR